MMSGREEENLLVEAARYMVNRYFGKYRGIVKEVGDGDNLGMIKAEVPAVYGEGIESPWASPCVPFAGRNYGFLMLPELDDGVWIEFEDGDISLPIWTGCWWADDEMPEPCGPKVRALVTKAGKAGDIGHQIILDDDENRIQLLHAGGAELTMTENDITLKIGSAQIVLSSDGRVNINNGAFEVLR